MAIQDCQDGLGAKVLDDDGDDRFQLVGRLALSLSSSVSFETENENEEGPTDRRVVRRSPKRPVTHSLAGQTASEDDGRIAIRVAAAFAAA